MKRRWEQSGSWCVQAPCTHWSFVVDLDSHGFTLTFIMHTNICLRQIPFAIWRMFYSCSRKMSPKFQCVVNLCVCVCVRERESLFTSTSPSYRLLPAIPARASHVVMLEHV